MIADAAQVEQVRKLINDEVSRIAKTTQSDYDRARTNEENLERNLYALKAEATNTGQLLVRLRELEREANQIAPSMMRSLAAPRRLGSRKALTIPTHA